VHSGAQLNCGLGRCGTPKRPLDHRPSDPQVDEILITRLERTAKPERQILRIGPGFDKQVKNVWSPLPEQPPSAGEKRMGLQVVRNPSTEETESVSRGSTWIDAITLEHHRLMTRSRDSQRGCQPGDAAPGNDELHLRNPAT
jgi:hypothetical protein